MKKMSVQNLEPSGKPARKGRRTSREEYGSTKSTKHIDSINPMELTGLLGVDAAKNPLWQKPNSALPIDKAIYLIINPEEREDYAYNISAQVPRTSKFIIMRRANIVCPYQYVHEGLFRAFMVANTFAEQEEYQKSDCANRFKDIHDLSNRIILSMVRHQYFLPT